MNDAELAILSIIAEAPITGYNLQAVIDQRNLRVWTQIGVRSIDIVLDKLHKRGLIELVRRHDGRPWSPPTFRITEAGIGLLNTSVADLLSSPRRNLQSFELGLANLTVLGQAQVRHALYSYRIALQNRHRTLSHQFENLQNDTAELPFHIQAMFEHQLTLLQAEIAWFDGWIEQWEAQLPAEETSQAPASEEENRLLTETSRMRRLVMPHDPHSFHKISTVEHPATNPSSPSDPNTRLNQATNFQKLNPDAGEASSQPD